MIQILLIVIGIVILAKGSLKVSETRTIKRPLSTYWGLITVTYGIAMTFPEILRSLAYSLAFFGSYIAVSFIVVMKGQRVESAEAVAKSKNTKRNTIVLLVFIAVLVAFFYFYMKSII